MRSSEVGGADCTSSGPSHKKRTTMAGWGEVVGQGAGQNYPNYCYHNSQQQTRPQQRDSNTQQQADVQLACAEVSSTSEKAVSVAASPREVAAIASQDNFGSIITMLSEIQAGECPDLDDFLNEQQQQHQQGGGRLPGATAPGHMETQGQGDRIDHQDDNNTQTEVKQETSELDYTYMANTDFYNRPQQPQYQDPGGMEIVYRPRSISSISSGSEGAEGSVVSDETEMQVVDRGYSRASTDQDRSYMAGDRAYHSQLGPCRQGVVLVKSESKVKDDKYWERRRKNNLAAKKSRDARRVRENQLRLRVLCLENANRVLRTQMDREHEENVYLREKLKKVENEKNANTE